MNRSGVNPRVQSLVGLPYQEDGGAPETGFSCWGLVLWCRFEIYGLETPHVLGDHDLATNEGRIGVLEDAARMSGWREVSRELAYEGDVVLLSTRGDGRPHHCGLVANRGAGVVVHAYAPVGGGAGQVYATAWEALARVFQRATVHQWRS